MSNSNPQFKEYIREHLKDMYLELQEASKARKALYRAGKAKAGNFGGEGDVNATESGGRSGTGSANDSIAKRNFRSNLASTPGPGEVIDPRKSAAQARNADAMGKEVSRWKAGSDVNSRMAGDFSKQRDSAEGALRKTQGELWTSRAEASKSEASRKKNAGRAITARRGLQTANTANVKLAGDLGTTTAANVKLAGDLGTTTAANVKLTGDLGTANAANVKLTGDLGTANTTSAKLAGDLAVSTDEIRVRTGSEKGARLQIDKLTAAANAKPMAKWTAGVKSVDSKLFGNAAQGGAASTKGLMGSGGKVGMGTKLAGAGAAAALQGMSSADTEWKENKNKGMSDAENMGKTAVRGTAAAAGAGLGTYGGMAAGAALGSAVGPVGTLIGAAIGGIAGGWGGGALADKAADMVTNIGDNDSEIAKFRTDREIEGIQNAGRIQKAKQDVADAGRTKGSGAVPVGGASTSSDDGEDFENNQTSADGRQQQSVRYSSRGNGYGAGGNVNFDVNQRQRR